MRSAVLLAALWAQTVAGLRVADGSPCDIKCGNVLDNTVSADMVCAENAYASSAGVVFQSCVECELSSTYSNKKQTDLQWVLYNMRYAVSYCLFGYPDNKNFGVNPCITSTACGPLERAFEYDSLAQNVSAYEYCTFWNQVQVPKCSACLLAGDNDYLNNFLTVLHAACLQQPASGALLSVQGSPFSRTPVNITDPNPIPTGVADYTQGGFSLGAKVGIAIGGLLFILAILGCCVVWNGRRRRRAFLKRLQARNPPTTGNNSAWASPQQGQTEGGTFSTPMSQRPLRGWDDSPMSAGTEKTLPRYFSPYSSQYNSPISGVDGPANAAWPAEKTGLGLHHPQPIGIALGGSDDAYHDMSPHKGKDKDAEAYEMQSVVSEVPPMPVQPQAPVLHHPGYGRQGPNLPRSALTAEDMQRGYAV